MSRSIRPEILARVEAIEWCAKCNELFDLNLAYPTRQVSNWKRAEVHWNKQSWEDAQGDARNNLSGYLSVDFPQEFDYWNDLIRSAKKHMQEMFYPAVETFALQHGLPQSFIINVRWDILIAIMEDAYSDCNLPVTFYSDLLKVYEAGHMPCGWEHGEWPTGTLIVY